MANFSATQILREIRFGKSKALERTILTYVDEALVSQNLLDFKRMFTCFLNCTKNTLPSSPISQLWQIDHNQNTLLMSQFEKFEINLIRIRFENFENQFEKFEKFLVSQFEIRFDSKAK